MPNLTTLTLAAGTAATSVLDETTKAAISQGFNQLSATVTDVIGIAIPVSVSIIALTAGVKYALKKVRGVISNAA